MFVRYIIPVAICTLFPGDLGDHLLMPSQTLMVGNFADMGEVTVFRINLWLADIGLSRSRLQALPNQVNPPRRSAGPAEAAK